MTPLRRQTPRTDTAGGQPPLSWDSTWAEPSSPHWGLAQQTAPQQTLLRSLEAESAGGAGCEQVPVCRYQVEVGKGRFKKVYKGFDERRGIDIAWSKLSQESLSLDDEQLAAVAQEMRKGLELDHPNIIKCYLTWQVRHAGSARATGGPAWAASACSACVPVASVAVAACNAIDVQAQHAMQAVLQMLL